MSLRAQLSVAVAATAAVSGIAPAAADSSTSAETAAVAHPAKLGAKAPSLTYRAASHDTLETVAKRTGVSPTAIAQANKLTGPLRTGQLLTIPAAPGALKAPLPAEPSGSLSHTVQRGETLSGIARQHGTTVAAVAQANGIADPARIYVGQRISIPGAAQPSPQAAAQSSAQTNGSHTVQRGETLSGIARQHGTTVAAIAQANGIADPARIYAGKTLTIPGAATAISQTPQNPVPKTFLHYTYPDSTNSAANANKLALERAAVPSRAQMQEIVRSTAVQMGVDPKLALAHAYVESGFDMRSVSPANAIGVMQVIPSSGEWASRLVGRRLNLLDPHDNAVAGVAIIRFLQSNADGADQGIAGYYQGLGGVRKNGMKPDTVAYVNRVKAARARF
mgnify:FL=1